VCPRRLSGACGGTRSVIGFSSLAGTRWLAAWHPVHLWRNRIHRNRAIVVAHRQARIIRRPDQPGDGARAGGPGVSAVGAVRLPQCDAARLPARGHSCAGLRLRSAPRATSTAVTYLFFRRVQNTNLWAKAPIAHLRFDPIDGTEIGWGKDFYRRTYGVDVTLVQQQQAV